MFKTLPKQAVSKILISTNFNSQLQSMIIHNIFYYTQVTTIELTSAQVRIQNGTWETLLTVCFVLLTIMLTEYYEMKRGFNGKRKEIYFFINIKQKTFPEN